MYDFALHTTAGRDAALSDDCNADGTANAHLEHQLDNEQDADDKQSDTNANLNCPVAAIAPCVIVVFALRCRTHNDEDDADHEANDG